MSPMKSCLTKRPGTGPRFAEEKVKAVGAVPDLHQLHDVPVIDGSVRGKRSSRENRQLHAPISMRDGPDQGKLDLAYL